MLRLLSLSFLTILFLSCGGSEAQSVTKTAAPVAELKLNEKNRVSYSAVLTIADGPFAGTYELESNKDNRGSLIINGPTKKFLGKRPQFAGKTHLAAVSMTTADGGFGIMSMDRWFNGDPGVGHLSSHKHVAPSGGEAKCGGMRLFTDDPSGVIRHVYVEFLECGGMDVAGFGNEWQTSKYNKTRKRPMAGSFSERVRIEDVNSTNNTREEHETTLTLTFVGGHSVETED